MHYGTKLLAFITVFVALPTLGHELTVKVDNIRAIKGNLLVAVYDREENYNTNSKWIAAKKIKITETTVLFDFSDLPSGSYAIKLFQDENENGQIDKNVVGIPSEPYGFSNNGGTFAPPSFDEAKIVVDKAAQVEIQLR